MTDKTKIHTMYICIILLILVLADIFMSPKHKSVTNLVTIPFTQEETNTYVKSADARIRVLEARLALVETVYQCHKKAAADAARLFPEHLKEITDAADFQKWVFAYANKACRYDHKV